VLSGGEKTRLALVKLLLDPPNLLLMDEPTTHLDIGSIDALIGALRQYEGTLIFISHDVHFIRAIASTVLHISAGRLNFYPGDYQYYLDKSRAGSERAALVAGDKLQNAQPTNEGFEPPNGGFGSSAKAAAQPGLGMKEMREQRRAEAEKRKAESKAKRDAQKQAEALEMRIFALEGRQKEITAELENPAAYEAGGAAVRLNRELLTVTEELERVMKEWEGMAVNK
jgi:ATP-binding cassette subfamily F protein 3